jgi:DNA-binding response OmpR family regulator
MLRSGWPPVVPQRDVSVGGGTLISVRVSALRGNAAFDLEEALTRAGFAADVVSSGEEALTLFVGGIIPYRALPTDIRLRGRMSGREVARRIRERQPAIPVVYATAALAEEWASQGVPNSIFIPKPFPMARLVSAIANLLNVGTPRTA